VPALGAEGHDALAEAISKIDELRLSHPPTPVTTPPESASASNPASRRASQVGIIPTTVSEKRFYSPPATPHFGAQTDLLRQLDDSTKVIRQSRDSSDGLKRAPSVSGIGGVVEKPDYSEAKIVVAMVGLPARGKSYLSNKMMRYLRVR
jgi:6-phosphofructo-2-kinase/fructose-2,6-biphosphatase 2